MTDERFTTIRDWTRRKVVDSLKNRSEEYLKECVEELTRLRAENAALRARVMSEDELVEMVAAWIEGLTLSLREHIRNHIKSRTPGIIIHASEQAGFNEGGE